MERVVFDKNKKIRKRIALSCKTSLRWEEKAVCYGMMKSYIAHSIVTRIDNKMKNLYNKREERFDKRYEKKSA